MKKNLNGCRNLPIGITRCYFDQRCVQCHGANFTTPPLGRVHHIIRDSKARIVKMIKYYQNPKDSDEMVMKGFVKNFTNAQINAIADYIMNLKK
jgi:cytochrome c553